LVEQLSFIIVWWNSYSRSW